MTFEPLDVVVVPFPFSDRAATRRRPALVVSSAGFNTAHRQTILAMITPSPTTGRATFPYVIGGKRGPRSRASCGSSSSHSTTQSWPEKWEPCLRPTAQPLGTPLPKAW